MKQKLSVTIEKDLLKKIEENTKGSRFRNKSHLVEFAVHKLLEKETKNEM